MTYIKTLTAPLIIIAGLALLTACGGGAAPDEDPAVDCTETPFDSPDMCEDEKDTICQTYGTGDKGHASCADRINTACVANPFVYDGCDTLDDAIRNNFCALPANIFAHAECMNVSNINNLRTTFCEMPDNRFNADCITNNLGGGGRMTFCEMPDNRFNQGCIDNKLNDNGRTTFCEMPANIFTHEDCKTISNINDIRMTFCSVTDIFHMTCLDDTYGGDDERDDACQTHGTNVGAGGHASCDGGNNDIRTACVLNPFVYKGCDTLDTDDEKIRDDFCKMEQHIFTHAKCMDIKNIDDIRNTYCSVTEIFHASCLDGTNGGDNERDNACLISPAGVPAHPSCANRPEVIQTCTADPFLVTTPANTGCENLATIVSIREVYCGTSANFAGRCTVDYDDWKDSFGTGKAPPTRPNTTTGEQQNEFLNAGEEALADAVTAFTEIEVMQTVEPDTLDFSGSISGSATANSVSYFSVNGSSASIRYYYAGLDSRADLGAPSFQETGTATWVGKFQVLIGADDALDVQDFELTVNFETSTITSLIRQGITNNYFYLNGVYDSNGVIDGTVNYTELTTAITANDRTTIMNDATPEGILTGLIGRQGAVGAFLSGTGDKDDITGGTSATDGFAGGFVANPFDGNVSYRDWASSSSPPATPAAAPPSDNLNQFVQTIRNDVIKAAHVGQNFNVNLGSLDGDPADGFSVYHVTATDDYLVGLSATTSLGAVLTRATGTGSWKGSFVAYEGGVATTTPFELMVDFANRNIDATVTGTDYSFANTSFGSANGVLRGNVNRGATTGNLAGLIGSDGAVGVFHSDNNLPDSFAGGFVAVSHAFDGRVNYADWLEVTTPDTARAAPLANQFLAGADGVTTLTNGTVGFVNLNNAKPTGMDTTAFGGDVKDGFHVYSNDRSTGTDPTNFYAGILTTTNLGAPLTMQTASGTWQGRLFAARDTVVVNAETLINAEVADFAPTVNFGMKTISATITGVTNFGGVDIPANTVSYDFTAVWDARGVFQGTINRTLSSVASTGVLTGLIGAEGAVGVFISDAGEPVGYAGGFVARKAP